MSDPLVTIAIPTRNRADYLKIAIESAVRQSYPNVEVLVSDNVSEDHTPAVLAADHGSRVRTWRQEVNLGMAGNWNFLLNQARGEYFCLLSDDDFLYPDFAKRLVECFRSNPGATLAYSGCEVTDGISTFYLTGYPSREPGLVLVEEAIKGARTLFLCSLLLPAKALREGGGFPDYKFSADSGAWMPLLFHGDAVHAPEILSHYTAQSGSISANIPMAEIIGDLQRLVGICASDSRVPPARRKRLRSLGRKMLARKAGRLLLHRAALGTPKVVLLRAMPSLARFMSYDVFAAAPAVLSALFLPAALMRRVKAVFRKGRDKGTLSPQDIM